MGRKRSRNTAKTGDKAIYKARRDADEEKLRKKDTRHHDPMDTEVDRFHNERDEEFIRLTRLDNGNDDDGEDEDQVDPVMDLGIGGVSSDEESEEDEDDGARYSHMDDHEDDEEEYEENDLDPVSSSEDDKEEMDLSDVRNWGKRKSAYYHGDTADLEIGQDEEDAYLEEEAAKEVQTARLKDLSEEDFLLPDADDEDDGRDEDEEDDEKKSAKKSSTKVVPSVRDLSKLSARDRKRILEKDHPEILPILAYFSKTVGDLDQKTSVAFKALFDGEEGTAESVGSTQLGQQYLFTKWLLQSSIALNLATFLLLKTEQISSQKQETASSNNSMETSESVMLDHPIYSRLKKLEMLQTKLEARVERNVDDLDKQMERLVEAAALVKDEDEHGVGSSDDEEDNEEDNDREDEGEDHSDDADVVRVDENEANGKPKAIDDEPAVPRVSDAKNSSLNALNEARFGLRPSEITQSKAMTIKGDNDRKAVSKKMRKKQKSSVSASDIGDDEYNEDDEIQKAASKALASTLNAIEQRSATRQQKKKKKAQATVAERLDEHMEYDDVGMMDDDGNGGTEEALQRGLAMMEDDIGKEDDEEMAEDEDDDDDFYTSIAKKSKSKKALRKERYQVAPKFPRVEGEIEGERAISKTILKNRGLVAHKPKLNRNPRVKKKVQYNKALIRRKGAVRDIRTNEGHQYGGESTGIKTNVSKSRKLV